MPQVIVGCKIPSGLIMELIEPAPANQIMPKLAQGKRVVLPGAHSRIAAGTNPVDLPPTLTPVDAEFAEAWFKRNKDLSFVQSGLVFIETKQSDAEARAKDITPASQLPTGLEPLTQDDRRIPKGVTPDADQLGKLRGRAA